MRNYIVIGGSSGIGEAVVNLLEQKGNKVWASYCSTETPSRSNASYFPFDAMADDLDLDQFPEVIDGVVYCPGSINLKPFHRLKPEEFLADYKLQVLGAIRVIQQLLPYLKKSNTASIVLFSTVAVQMGFAFHAQVSASKGAIEGLTRALAAEFAPNIRVNAIAPSLTNTKLAERLLSTPEKIKMQSEANPLKRIGMPDDIAEAVVYLLSSTSSWITGQVIAVDGGFSRIK